MSGDGQVVATALAERASSTAAAGHPRMPTEFLTMSIVWKTLLAEGGEAAPITCRRRSLRR